MSEKGKIVSITLPTDDATIRALHIGDEVRITGQLVTARDVAHKFMIEHKPEWLRPILENRVIYHLGPVVRKTEDGYTIVAAGPTTSIREEPYQADVIGHYGVRGVIGKGGMGPKTLAGLKEHGAVYFHAIGGAAAVLASSIKRVVDVHKLEEFGTPEAFWVLDVVDFPAVVTMDSHGQSLHEKIKATTGENLQRLLQSI